MGAMSVAELFRRGEEPRCGTGGGVPFPPRRGLSLATDRGGCDCGGSGVELRDAAAATAASFTLAAPSPAAAGGCAGAVWVCCCI